MNQATDKKPENGWIGVYEGLGALWIHDGNVQRPHALLTSGKHSNGFFNSRMVIPNEVIPDETLLRQAASDLLELFALQGGDISTVQCVVGPQTGATKLAELLSEKIQELSGQVCDWASPAKSETDGQKSMTFSDEDLAKLPDQYLLPCEDVITTGGSVERTLDASVNAGGNVLPLILALVNRSGLTEVNGKKIVALIDHHMPMWEPDECPLCAQGSEAIRPKETGNWVRLNAEYPTQ